MIVGGNAQSLEERVFLALEEEILAGQLKKGETLTEVALSARHGVSRTPLRGAL
ncbi:MAG: GntR family transcriptional regulator, partial [Clostridia bacterium]|nr:GntR family transcriptional regulator [Clostridia bacterium]